MMGYGYEPIIAIICTFRSLISNILRRFKDSTKARSHKNLKLKKVYICLSYLQYPPHSSDKRYSIFSNLTQTQYYDISISTVSISSTLFNL